MKVIDFLELTHMNYFDFVLVDAKNGRKYTKIKKYENCEVLSIFPTLEVTKNVAFTGAYPKIGLFVYHDDILKCKGE